MARTRHHPRDNRQVNERQADQKAYHDRKARERSLTVGQRVVVKNQIPGKTWVLGTIEKVQGPLTYLVQFRYWTDMLTMSEKWVQILLTKTIQE